MKRLIIATLLSLLPLFSFAQTTISVQYLVEHGGEYNRRYRVVGKFVKMVESESLTFLLEDKDYIIPVRMQMLDLGAAKRFQNQNLQWGDRLCVEGAIREVEINGHAYCGLVDAVIIDKTKTPHANGGDVVEVPAPEPEEPKLDPRASFPSMSKKENKATAPHSASEASEGFNVGQANGNTPQGKTEGSANVHVKGRNVVGSLPKPSYNSQTEGIVVVQIKIDQFGHVKEATPGADGTTTKDKTLWNAARSAALKAHFNQSASTPALQTGTITYIFKLK